MDQNMILNEVIEIMVAKYRFKATQVFPLGLAKTFGLAEKDQLTN